ncbi:cytochrome P450 [Aspergillus melleus]|uniref:cytochrome P450 n=1 Tax=Aspergillus melleus TaxID=138277 RepID=UPI001E8D872E|nr:uncharacterized protein LDX57_000006 [Aspergillus melleus]KAH8422248.1 hypothetical protein LDX57_000006 [Aspergillus melleus]
MTDDGCLIVLAPEFAKEIRNSPALSVGRFMAERLHAHLDGFEPWRQISAPDRIFPDTIRTKLMQPLGRLIQPASVEMASILRHEWTDETEWHRVALKPSALAIVVRLLSVAFWPEPLHRDARWLRIVGQYSIDSFVAADALHRWPRMLRPVISWIAPSCRKIRLQLREARAIMAPILRQREADALTSDDDALRWMEECARGRPYDPVMAQLGMAAVSLHSTADMLTQVLYDLCGRDELIVALRDETRSVVQREGLTVSALNNLHLMDSTLKESQRLKPSLAAAMQRISTDPITLSDGTRIPRNSYTIVSADRRLDANVYPDPDTFDAYRSVRLRQTAGKETYAQVTTPSPEHLAWGFGKHACPGRNLVVTEIKIALAHILLKYDLQLVDGLRPQPLKHGIVLSANSTAVISVRRREDDVSLLS